MNEEFTRLVKSKLAFSSDKCVTVTLEHIDEKVLISSASQF